MKKPKMKNNLWKRIRVKPNCYVTVNIFFPQKRALKGSTDLHGPENFVNKKRSTKVFFLRWNFFNFFFWFWQNFGWISAEFDPNLKNIFLKIIFSKWRVPNMLQNSEESSNNSKNLIKKNEENICSTYCLKPIPPQHFQNPNLPRFRIDTWSITSCSSYPWIWSIWGPGKWWRQKY